jgi:hypothetical protein
MITGKTAYLPVFYRFRNQIAIVFLTSALLSCGDKKPASSPEQQTLPAVELPIEHASVQVRIYHVAQSSYPDGNYQEFGLYIDNHTPDTLCTVSGRLVYCGQHGDTLAFLDFVPAGSCSTSVMLITGQDTVKGIETFEVFPGRESMESVHFRWKETSTLRPELKSMPDRFSCLWFGN